MTTRDAGRSVARIDGENGSFSRREPAMTKPAPPPHYWERCGPKSAKPCRGKPFDLQNGVGIGKSKRKCQLKS